MYQHVKVCPEKTNVLKNKAYIPSEVLVSEAYRLNRKVAGNHVGQSITYNRKWSVARDCGQVVIKFEVESNGT